ncbi:hypothetical protein [Rhodococcus erythropolis]|nr:hypothetical protein [Rhodococcus erythropolis]
MAIALDDGRLVFAADNNITPPDTTERLALNYPRTQHLPAL